LNGSMKIALAAAIAAALGAIAVTVWVGTRVREDTVVASPYEDGLRHDAERRARAALGLAVRLVDDPPALAGPLAFELVDREGAPVEAAAIRVEISRRETSRDGRAAAARAEGGGRFVAELAFPAPGPWDVRFDVVHGADRVRLERRVDVRPGCDLSAGPCTRPLPGGGEVTLEISPRPARVMREIAVRAEVREASRPELAGPIPVVRAAFSMPGMDMGENRVALGPTGPGRFEGIAVLVRCPSGRRGWIAEVEVARPGGPPRTARFELTVAE
jgi:nitrogen fixation protein FixH